VVVVVLVEVGVLTNVMYNREEVSRILSYGLSINVNVQIPRLIESAGWEVFGVSHV